MIPRRWFRTPVTVRTRTGQGAHGPVLAAPVTVLANVDATERLVRSRTGQEVVSSTTVRVLAKAALPDGRGTAVATAVLTLDSEVEVLGTTAKVLALRPRLRHGRLEYLEANLS